MKDVDANATTSSAPSWDLSLFSPPPSREVRTHYRVPGTSRRMNHGRKDHGRRWAQHGSTGTGRMDGRGLASDDDDGISFLSLLVALRRGPSCGGRHPKMGRSLRLRMSAEPGLLLQKQVGSFTSCAAKKVCWSGCDCVSRV